MDNIKIMIGKTKNSICEYNFNKEDIISIIPNQEYLLSPSKQKKRGNDILVKQIIKKNNDGKYVSARISKRYSLENKDIVENEINEIYQNDDNIIKGIINITIEELCKLSPNELKLFNYVPNYTIFQSISPPIDPYYVGYWLGDGHSEDPSRLTIGNEDQPIMIPYLKELCIEYSLKLHEKYDKKGLGFALTKGSDGLGNNVNQQCFDPEWLKEAIDSCKKLELSKNTDTPYTNFRKNYDPIKEYLKGDNYYCPCCNYNTENINKRQDTILIKSKQYYLTTHIRKIHNFDLKRAQDVWSSLNKEEKDSYKIVDNKKDICKKNKFIDWVTLWYLYKNYYQNYGEKGIQIYVDEQKNKCNILRYWFNKMDLKGSGKKHIPEIYKKSSINDRLSLMAGLIDSDGTSGGKSKNNLNFEITQKNKKLIEDIKEVSESLGWFCYLTEKYCRAVTTLEDGTKKRSNPILNYRLIITPYNNCNIPIKLERKKIKNLILDSCEHNGVIRRERHLPYPNIYLPIQS